MTTTPDAPDYPDWPDPGDRPPPHHEPEPTVEHHPQSHPTGPTEDRENSGAVRARGRSGLAPDTTDRQVGGEPARARSGPPPPAADIGPDPTVNVRRPITPDELPHLRALGEALRSMRKVVGLTQRKLAGAAQLSTEHVGAIERGQRRTRRSTLHRIAAVLAEDPEAAVAELVELAGPALGPESSYAERLERRRRRWERRRTRQTVEAFEAAIAQMRRTAPASPDLAGGVAPIIARLEGEADRLRELERSKWGDQP